MFHTTPNEITDEVAAFCRSISKHEPVFLDIQPWQAAKQQECFTNVKAKVEVDGGERVFGWVIWYHPGVFIEAENHAVWRNDNDELVDITSPPSGEARVLFLRDDTAKPYETTGLNSRRKALTKDPLVVKFVSYGTKVGHARVQQLRGLHVDPNTQIIFMKMARVEQQIKAKYGDAYPS